MESVLVGRILGPERCWHGPCTLVIDADASVSTLGSDSIVSGGNKHYAPRLVSGRINAEAVCWMQELQAVLIIQQHKVRQPTGEDVLKQMLTVVDMKRVVAVEFSDTAALKSLGITPPSLRPPSGQSGLYSRPM